MTDTTKVEDQVRKLLAKANGTESEHEAAAFAAKAAEILQRHNLDMAKVVAGGRDPLLDAKVEERRVDEYLKPWMVWVHGSLSRLYFCDIYRHSFVWKGKKQSFLVRGVTYVGKPHNLEVAVSMAKYLVDTVNLLAKQYSRDPKQQDSFRKGCASRLYARLDEMREQAAGKVQAEVTSNPGNLPALYASESSQVESFLATKGLVQARKQKTHVADNSAYLAGSRAGDSVSLNTQVGGSKVKVIAA